MRAPLSALLTPGRRFGPRLHYTNSRPALEISNPPQNAISPKSGYSSHEVFNQSVNV